MYLPKHCVLRMDQIAMAIATFRASLLSTWGTISPAILSRSGCRRHEGSARRSSSAGGSRLAHRSLNALGPMRSGVDFTYPEEVLAKISELERLAWMTRGLVLLPFLVLFLLSERLYSAWLSSHPAES